MRIVRHHDSLFINKKGEYSYSTRENVRRMTNELLSLPDDWRRDLSSSLLVWPLLLSTSETPLSAGDGGNDPVFPTGNKKTQQKSQLMLLSTKKRKKEKEEGQAICARKRGDKTPSPGYFLSISQESTRVTTSHHQLVMNHLPTAHHTQFPTKKEENLSEQTNSRRRRPWQRRRRRVCF